MRAGALSDKTVGAYVKEHYISSWQRVGTFTAVQAGGKTVARAGGNVAVYFCTPDLDVIHAIAGPVGTDALLEAAKWAVETFEAARKQAGDDREALVKAIREAHDAKAKTPPCLNAYRCVPTVRVESAVLREKAGAAKDYAVVLGNALGATTTDLLYRPQQVAPAEARRACEDGVAVPAEATTARASAECLKGEQIQLHAETVLADAQQALLVAIGGGRTMHHYLAEQGTPKLEDIYKHVFERVLGERVTDTPVRTVDMPRMRTRQMVVQTIQPARESEDLRAKVQELQKQVEQLQKKVKELESKQE